MTRDLAMPPEPPRLDAEAFRRDAHRLADWMADYLAGLEALRVQPDVQPGSLRDALPPDPPLAGEPFDRIFADFERLIVPGLTHWQHPGFYAYFPGNNSPASILAEMLTAAVGAQCMSWITSPAATELEQVTVEWLRRMIGLPESFTGVIQDTASTATLVALITARDRILGAPDGGPAAGPGERAASADLLTVYASAEAHSSVAKGARLAGYRPDHVRLIETDTAYAMRPQALAARIVGDRAEGLVPAVVVATLGTTSSTAVDPVPAVAAVARREGLWLHVDAAFAGSAAILPELAWIMKGVEHADSFVFNPHKWLLVNFDCSAYFVRDVPALLRSFSASPDYLKTLYDADVVNYRDWGIQLGRRFRALKLWFVLRTYGVEGLRALLREHIRLGELFAAWVDAAEDFERLAPAPLALVCFRHRRVGEPEGEGLDGRNQRLLSAVNATGRGFLTHTRLGGRYVLRLALGHLSTTEAYLRQTWELIQRLGRGAGQA